jgi:hypothetical protein
MGQALGTFCCPRSRKCSPEPETLSNSLLDNKLWRRGWVLTYGSDNRTTAFEFYDSRVVAYGPVAKRAL